MGGVGSPLCFLGGVCGGATLDCTSAVTTGKVVADEAAGKARGDPTEGGNLAVETAGVDVVGAEATRGEIAPKEDTVGPIERAF